MVNILFVDDNLDRIRSIRSILPKDKVKTEYVTTKSEALRMVSKEVFDLGRVNINIYKSA